MYRKHVEVRPFDETKADHGYAETDPTGRYGRVSFSLLYHHHHHHHHHHICMYVCINLLSSCICFVLIFLQLLLQVGLILIYSIE
jgi:hypothetical protein